MSKNITIDQGKTKILNLSFTDENGVAYNLTGATVYLTVKKKYTQTDAQANLQKTITVHTDAVNGITQIEFIPADTATIPIGNYFYDVQIVDSNNKKFVVFDGVFFVKDTVTKT